jgi:hypothetical protein
MCVTTTISSLAVKVLHVGVLLLVSGMQALTVRACANGMPVKCRYSTSRPLIHAAAGCLAGNI